MSRFVWVKMMTGHASGWGTPEYREYLLEDGEEERVALEAAHGEVDYQDGDGIRKGHAEIVPYPPAEWMADRMATLPDERQALVELGRRLHKLSYQAMVDLPWSVGETWTGRLLKRFATEADGSAWLADPRNYRVDKARLEAGDYWLTGPSEDAA